MRSVVRPRSALPGNSRLGEPGEPGRGEGSGGDAHAPCPGGGLRTPALLPRGGEGRQGKARQGARGGGESAGHGNEVGGQLPAPPPAWRTTGSRCCPLPPTAPRTPRSCPAPRGASGELQLPGPWEPEPTLITTDRFPVRKLPVTLEKPVGPAWSQAELATFHYSPVTSLLL